MWPSEQSTNSKASFPFLFSPAVLSLKCPGRNARTPRTLGVYQEAADAGFSRGPGPIRPRWLLRGSPAPLVPEGDGHRHGPSWDARAREAWELVSNGVTGCWLLDLGYLPGISRKPLHPSSAAAGPLLKKSLHSQGIRMKGASPSRSAVSPNIKRRAQASPTPHLQ